MTTKRIPFYPDKIYHVFSHGNAEDNIFRSDKNYYRFLENYARYITPIAHTFAYCLLPNHFHFLLMIKPENELVDYYRNNLMRKEPINLAGQNIQQFSNLLNSYAKYFNLKYDRRGSLFLNNLERRLIDNNTYLQNALSYIHFNPVKHGLVTDIQDYIFTSYHAYTSSKETKVNRDLTYKLLNEKSTLTRKPEFFLLDKYALDMDVLY